MSERDVVVVGGGAAGTAAAWTLAEAGINVTLLKQRAGATELYSGALDWEPWERDAGGAMGSELGDFSNALGIWELDQEPRLIATTAGVLRGARGTDRALLDLTPLAGAHVAVADTDREGFDGQILAHALQRSDWALETGTRFSAVRVNVLREPNERYFGEFDFARLHEAQDRRAWLGKQLRGMATSYGGWLLGPWLGVAREVATELSEEVGCPVGETTSLPGGPAGARFAVARDRLLEGLGVRVITTRVRAVEETPRGWTVELSPDEQRASAPLRIPAKAIVIASGGIVGGGLRLAAPSDVGQPGFRLSFRARVPLVLDGRCLGSVGSMHGVEPVNLGAGALERVGIDVCHGRVRGVRRLFAAGACVGGRPRTVLSAVSDGVVAARAAIGKRAEHGCQDHVLRS